MLAKAKAMQEMKKSEASFAKKESSYSVWGKPRTHFLSRFNMQTPYCNFDNGKKITISEGDSLSLGFAVQWAGIAPHSVMGKWNCWIKDESDPTKKDAKKTCENAEEMIKYSHLKDFTAGNFTVAPNTFKAGDSATIHLTVRETKTRVRYTCGINLLVQPNLVEEFPETVVNIPLRVHSDVPFNNHIDMSRGHSFACDIDY